jgi:dihydrofolate reductase
MSIRSLSGHTGSRTTTRPKETTMAKLRVHCFSLSLDGYGAGPEQSLDDPVGAGGRRLHEWLWASHRFQETLADGPATDGDAEDDLDDLMFLAGDEGIGATIMGRNMFGPVRGEWPDERWRGWWGEEPPYHHPVFVLTNHARPSFEMEGGTTFHFVTDGIEAALAQAVTAADGKDVRLGGGVQTIQQYLRAGLVDELHLAIVPTLLGDGERLFDHLDGGPDGYECTELVTSPTVAHVRLVRTT